MLQILNIVNTEKSLESSFNNKLLNNKYLSINEGSLIDEQNTASIFTEMPKKERKKIPNPDLWKQNRRKHLWNTGKSYETVKVMSL